MSINRLLNLKGANYWSLALAISLNIFWVVTLTRFVLVLLLQQMQGSTTTVQVILIAAAFAGPFLIAWLVSALAHGLKGPTYGFYGGLTSAVMLLILAYPAGLLVLMLIVAAISGGLNGGSMRIRGK